MALPNMKGGADVLELYAVVITIVAIVLGIFYITIYCQFMGYLWWSVEKNYTQPTKEQLDVCRKNSFKSGLSDFELFLSGF